MSGCLYLVPNLLGLVAPEFQIMTTITTITSANELRRQVNGSMNSDPVDALEVRLDLSDEIGVASDVRALVDRLDLLLMYGTMSQQMRAVLVGILERVSDPEDRARLAVQLLVISPEYNVLK